MAKYYTNGNLLCQLKQCDVDIKTIFDVLTFKKDNDPTQTNIGKDITFVTGDIIVGYMIAKIRSCICGQKFENPVNIGTTMSPINVHLCFI